MAIDRAEVRRRVRTVTAWAACGAAALTAGAAFGAARGSHAAKASGSGASGSADATAPAPAQDAFPQQPQDQQGFAPPSASVNPQQGMSGGS